MDNLALALGALAGLVQLAGYWQYNKVMLLGGHKPNPASWFMWAVGGFTELIVFAGLVEYGAEEVSSARAKEILPAVCAVVAIYTFARIWKRGASLDLDKTDKGIIVFDSLLVGYWFVTKNLLISNLLLGLDMIVSFWPCIDDVRKDPRSEHPSPWRTWTVAYTLLAVVVIIEWEGWLELIYPVVYAVLHGTIWYLSSVRTERDAAV